jgi:hypothetical protein
MVDQTLARPAAQRYFDACLVVWAIVSVVFWCWYSFATGTINPFAIYYPVWLGVVGTLVWRHRRRIERRLREWAAPPLAKFLVLGFGAVLTEEIIAALANHVPEGFSPVVFAVRVVQFWDLNIFTFFGFIVGWYGLTTCLAFTKREVFYLAGIWGLFAEKVIFAILSNPAFFVFDFSPDILTYGLIISPALLSQEPRTGRRRLHPIVKYPLTYAVIFLCSVPAIGVLQLLRQSFSGLFPPASMVPL